MRVFGIILLFPFGGGIMVCTIGGAFSSLVTAVLPARSIHVKNLRFSNVETMIPQRIGLCQAYKLGIDQPIYPGSAALALRFF